MVDTMVTKIMKPCFLGSPNNVHWIAINAINETAQRWNFQEAKNPYALKVDGDRPVVTPKFGGDL